MSIRKVTRKKGVSWEVRLQDSRGVDYYKTFPKKSLAEEYEKIEKLKKLKGFVLSTDNRKKKFTVKDLCEHYSKMKFPKLREGSIMSYDQYMSNHIIPFLGEFRVGSMKRTDVTSFENELLKSGYSIQSIHNIVFFLITLMNFASDELHWIERNQIKNYRPKKLEKSSTPLFWSKEEVSSFINNPEVKKNYYFDLYLFLLNTGCRIGEAGGLRVADIDFERNRVYIGWTLAKNNFRGNDFKGVYFSLNRQKGANDRFIPMNKTVRSILTKLVADKENGDFVFTNCPNSSRDIVFRDGNNKAHVISAPVINTQHFSESRFKALQNRIGIEPERRLGAHGLRHTFASHYVMNGGNLYVLSKLLGHSSIQITEIYAHLSPDYLMDIEKYVDFGRLKAS